MAAQPDAIFVIYPQSPHGKFAHSHYSM